MSEAANNAMSGLNRPTLWSIPQHNISPEIIDAKAQVLFERLNTIAKEDRKSTRLNSSH